MIGREESRRNEMEVVAEKGAEQSSRTKTDSTLLLLRRTSVRAHNLEKTMRTTTFAEERDQT
jgi:hypothetical protein